MNRYGQVFERPQLPASNVEDLRQWSKYYCLCEQAKARLVEAGLCTAERFDEIGGSVQRGLAQLQTDFLQEFGRTEAELAEWAKRRGQMPPHQFPPPQAGAETEIRGKLAGYRLNYLKREGDLEDLEAAWDVAIAEARKAYRKARREVGAVLE